MYRLIDIARTVDGMKDGITAGKKKKIIDGRSVMYTFTSIHDRTDHCTLKDMVQFRKSINNRLYLPLLYVKSSSKIVPLSIKKDMICLSIAKLV